MPHTPPQNAREITASVKQSSANYAPWAIFRSSMHGGLHLQPTSKKTLESRQDRSVDRPRRKVNNFFPMKAKRIIPGTIAAVLAAISLTIINPITAAADEKSKASAGTIADADKNFMVAAAEGGMLEVRLGEIAISKGSRKDVKDFGSMMVADHGKAGEDLKAVAAKYSVTLPANLAAEQQAIVDRLDKLSGAAFDEAYIEEMVKAHTKDASTFEEASKNAENPDVKAFAERTLPIIKLHLKTLDVRPAGKQKTLER